MSKLRFKLQNLALDVRVLSPLGIAMLIVLPVVLASLFHVWTNVTTVHLGYELSKASEAHKKLLEENRGLRIEVAALKAPGRLQRLAQRHYGLSAPKSEQVIRVHGGTK